MSRSTRGRARGWGGLAVASFGLGLVAFALASQLAAGGGTGLYAGVAVAVVSLATGALRGGDSSAADPSPSEAAGAGRADPEIETRLDEDGCAGESENVGDALSAEPEPTVESPIGASTTATAGGGTRGASIDGVESEPIGPKQAPESDASESGTDENEDRNPDGNRERIREKPDGVAVDEGAAELLETVTDVTRRAAETVESGEYAAAVAELEYGFGVCSAALDGSERGSDRFEAATDARAELLALVESRDAGASLAARADELRRSADAAIGAGDLGDARRSLEELDRLLAAVDDLELPSGERPDAVELDAERDDLGARLTDEVETRIDESVAAAETAREEARDRMKRGESGSAVLTHVERGREHCERAADLDRTHGTGREDELADVRTDLDDLSDRAAERSELASTAEERLEAARRAVRSRDFDAAAEAVAIAERTADELAADGASEAVTDPLRSAATAIEEEVAAERAKSSVQGSIGSVRATLSRAEALLEDGERDRAATRLESALETIARAEDLDRKHGLDRGESLAAERRSVESLLEEARVRPAAELSAALDASEAAVSKGIERREAGDLAAAVEAFEEAHRTYSDALELVERFELPERWEVEERRTLVGDYLEVVREELAERRRSVSADLDRQLERAGTALDRAEQFAEVEDHVSARESLGSAVRSLEGARRLVDTDVVDEPVDRYEELVSRVEALHGRLPAVPETGEYRIRDLVGSLQSLATKLGESPRPEFVNAYGDYPADAYLEAFGSWPETLAAANLDPVDEAARERRTYSRVEVLDALAELADELGHLPSKEEMNTHGRMSASPVTARFVDWETALELAGFTGTSDGGDGDHSPVRDASAPPRAGAEPGTESDPPDEILRTIEREITSLEGRPSDGGREAPDR